MRHSLLSFLLALVPLYTVAQQKTFPATPGQAEEMLAREVRVFDSKKTRMHEQLVELARAYHVPAGIEAVYRPEDKSIGPVHAEGVTVKEIVDRIVHGSPGYAWEVTNGVIHVFSESMSTDPRNFLNIQIPRFQLTNVDLLVASGQLRVAIRMALHPERYMQGSGGGMGWGWPPPKGFDTPNITLNERDRSVREILDRLILVNGRALWVVYLFPDALMEGEGFYLPTDYVFPGRKIETGFFWNLLPLE